MSKPIESIFVKVKINSKHALDFMSVNCSDCKHKNKCELFESLEIHRIFSTSTFTYFIDTIQSETIEKTGLVFKKMNDAFPQYELPQTCKVNIDPNQLKLEL